MLIKTPKHWEIPESRVTDEATYRDRRRFIQAGVYALAGAALGGCDANGSSHKAPAVAASRPGFEGKTSPEGEPLTPWEFVTGYNNFYEFGTGKGDPAANAGSLRIRPWTVRVDGECERPGEIGIEDILAKHPGEERIYRLRCVEAWSMVVPWTGFSLGDLLKSFAPTSRAKYVAFETLHDPDQMPGQRRRILRWPYTEGLRIDEAMHPLATLDTGVYGETLPNQNGAPLRLVVPWKYGFKSIKSIVRISFTREQPETAWNLLQPDEYGFYANVNPEVDHPRWSQASHRIIGAGLFGGREKTRMFNGYADAVADLYAGMDLKASY